MYLINTIENNDMANFLQEACHSPFSPKFNEVTAHSAVKMEVWGSSFKDEGDDFCEFRLINEKNEIISQKRVAGF